MRAKALLLGFLLLLSASQFLLIADRRPSLELLGVNQVDRWTFIVKYLVSSGARATNMNVVYFPVNNRIARNLPIYLYFNYTYNQVGSWTPYNMIVTGLYYDLQYWNKAANLKLDISLVNAQELDKVLSHGQLGVLIVPTIAYNVILPVPDSLIVEINSWVKNGGVAIWLGLPPDNFSSISGILQPQIAEPLITPNSSFEVATTETPISEALSLTYGLVNLGANTQALSYINGTALGKVYSSDGENRTSIALVPFGRGAMVLFGYGLYPPYWQTFIASDIIRIIDSGILNVAGPVQYQTYGLSSNVNQMNSITLNSRFSENWVIFAFSNDESAGFPGEYVSLDLSPLGA